MFKTEENELIDFNKKAPEKPKKVANSKAIKFAQNSYSVVKAKIASFNEKKLERLKQDYAEAHQELSEAFNMYKAGDQSAKIDIDSAVETLSKIGAKLISIDTKVRLRVEYKANQTAKAIKIKGLNVKKLREKSRTLLDSIKLEKTIIKDNTEKFTENIEDARERIFDSLDNNMVRKSENEVIRLKDYQKYSPLNPNAYKEVAPEQEAVSQENPWPKAKLDSEPEYRATSKGKGLSDALTRMIPPAIVLPPADNSEYEKISKPIPNKVDTPESVVDIPKKVNEEDSIKSIDDIDREFYENKHADLEPQKESSEKTENTSIDDITKKFVEKVADIEEKYGDTQLKNEKSEKEVLPNDIMDEFERIKAEIAQKAEEAIQAISEKTDNNTLESHDVSPEELLDKLEEAKSEIDKTSNNNINEINENYNDKVNEPALSSEDSKAPISNTEKVEESNDKIENDFNVLSDDELDRIEQEAQERLARIRSEKEKRENAANHDKIVNFHQPARDEIKTDEEWGFTPEQIETIRRMEEATTAITESERKIARDKQELEKLKAELLQVPNSSVDYSNNDSTGTKAK